MTDELADYQTLNDTYNLNQPNPDAPFNINYRHLLGISEPRISSRYYQPINVSI